MIQLGYLKDFIAVFLFLFIIYKIYTLNHTNIDDVKKELIIYFIIALLTDLLFSIFPNFHYSNLGYNYYSYTLFFITFITIGLFIYFNIY